MKVVNFKDYGSVEKLNEVFGHHWLYVGRANRYAGLSASPLANPFKVVHGKRGETLNQYRRWLWQQMKQEEVLNVLRSISEETILVCWCKPAACHGDVIIKAVEWLKNQEVEHVS